MKKQKTTATGSRTPSQESHQNHDIVHSHQGPKGHVTHDPKQVRSNRGQRFGRVWFPYTTEE